MSAPVTVVATGFAAKFTGSSVWATIAKLLLPFSGVLLGAVGGSLGVVIGARKWRNDAIDEQERRALRVHTILSVAVVLLFATSFSFLWTWTHSRAAVVAWFIAFIGALAVLQHVWLPRITSRRMQLEMHQDAQAAALKRRRERQQAMIGWTLGIVFGSMGLMLGLWFAR